MNLREQNQYCANLIEQPWQIKDVLHGQNKIFTFGQPQGGGGGRGGKIGPSVFCGGEGEMGDRGATTKCKELF